MPALSSADWFSGKTCQVATISLDPAKKHLSRPNPNAATIVNSATQLQQPTPENTNTATSTSTDTTTDAKADTKTDTGHHQNLDAKSVEPTTLNEGSVKEDREPDRSSPTPTATTSSAASTPSATPTTPIARKTLPKFGTVNPSVYKYMTNKTYHPSTHYDDLKGLNFNKSGTTELIQANARYIATPLSGPGGRIAVISTCCSTGTRLPPCLPCVVTGSDVTYFQFDPFDARTLATVSDDNKIRLYHIPEDGLVEDLSEATVILQGESSLTSLLPQHQHQF